MEQSYPNIRDGRKTVTTPGTAVRLAASNTPCRKVIITAFAENTDIVVIGDSTVVAATGNRRGTEIHKGESVTLYIEDLSTVYVDAVVGNEGVAYTYYF